MILSLPRKIGITGAATGALLSFSIAIEKLADMESILKGIQEAALYTSIGFLCCLIFLFCIPKKEGER